jgi:lysophospholipase L1-like esterase
MKIEPGSTLIFIGDSITGWGRERPLADEADDVLGTGYVQYVDSLLTAAYPGRRIRTFNMGVGGNTIRDLAARWQRHVLDVHPDWLSIMIGINDVWRQFDHWVPPDAQVSLDEYERTLGGLIRSVRPTLRGLVLMTPYFLEPDRSVPIRAMMDRYGGAVCRLASAHSAVFVDTQTPFDAAMRELAPEELADDRVHVNAVGHMILARAFLQAVGFSWQP